MELSNDDAQKTTINQFIEGEGLEETIVSNCPKYREKFLKIIEKLGIGESDIKDEEAREKIFKKSFRRDPKASWFLKGKSWNWAAALFTGYWAIYRKQRVLGWTSLIIVIFAEYVIEISSSGLVIGYVMVFGLYGNSMLLRNCIENYVSTTSPVDRKQKDPIGLVIAIAIALILTLWTEFG